MTKTIAILTTLLLAACPAPGEGAKAERGYRACEPVIDALARHFQRTGAYPETLVELVNPADGLAEVPRPNDNDLQYARKDNEGGYVLGFSYTGPGVNHCEITPLQPWSCHGYY